MPLIFENPPLAEIMAELRWVPSYAQIAQPGIPQNPQLAPLLGPPGLEEFFMRLGGELYQHNFRRSERIVPPGFFLMLHQAVYRYKATAEPAAELFQAGPGFFSANAIPPYKSWSVFSPFAEMGIRAMLNCRSESERELPLSVNLRYLNAFDARFTGDIPSAQFIRDVLGFRVDPPPAVTAILRQDAQIRPVVWLTIPGRDGLSTQIWVAEGLSNGAPAVIFDINVSCETPVVPSLVALMGVLSNAHTVIHEMFRTVTAPLHHIMKPREG